MFKSGTQVIVIFRENKPVKRHILKFRNKKGKTNRTLKKYYKEKGNIQIPVTLWYVASKSIKFISNCSRYFEEIVEKNQLCRGGKG